mgnify:FL=1
MPIFGSGTDLLARLPRRPDLPMPPREAAGVVDYLGALDRALVQIYDRLSERVQVWDSNAGLATMAAGATTVTVTFLGLEDDTQYVPLLIGNWEAGGLWATALTTSGFTINSSRSPVTAGTVLWVVVRPQDTTTTLASVAANPLGVPDGGTGVSTLAANGVLYGNGTGGVLATAQGPANSVLTANEGAPVFSASPTVTTLGVGTAVLAGDGHVTVKNGTNDPSISLLGRTTDNVSTIRFWSNDGVSQRVALQYVTDTFDILVHDGTSLVSRMKLKTGVQVGSPSGADKGAGTLNAVAVYDDGVLLTDWAFDLYFDGRVRPGDAHYRGQRLYPFEETLAVAQADRRLPWMPTRDAFEQARGLGAMVSRLWFGQEQQQMYLFEHERQITELSARVVALESDLAANAARSTRLEARLAALEARNG